MILVDNETKIDLLNNEAIALTIIKMMRERPDKPVTLGVHGDWGAGKSSVLEMIESSLKDEKKILCIKFNGWRFQGFEDAKIALIEGIVTSLLDERPALSKAKGAAKDILKRIDYLKAAKRGGGLIWNATTGMPSPDQIETVVGAVKNFGKNPSKEDLEGAAKQFSGLLKPAEARRMPEEIEGFRQEFKKLLDEAGIDQLVVLIDDLDRCLPDTTIETLEAIRLFVFSERTAFVVGADEAMVEYAVRRHFPELPASGPHDYARNYLEKLIQVPFRIPALGDTETRIYVTLLLIGAVIGDEDEDFAKLISAGREKLKRPWESKPLDAAAIKEALGEKAEDVQEMLALSDQIGPMLASGTKGNPRQIKRFLNALLLRKGIAEARGFGDDIQLPTLGKLMLAERFMPTEFGQIAANAASAGDGICKDIDLLEKHLSDTTTPQKFDEGSLAEEWVGSEIMQEWASLEPKLGATDLRPYLFVAKDRKDYFTASSKLGRLAEIVEQLLGPKITVSSMLADIRALTAPDAASVFEELRSHIMGNGDLTKRPPGADGIAALVEAHPVLEANLLDFLEGLPQDKIGIWPTGGWVIKDPANMARFDLLMARWSSVASNKPLQAAATAIRKAKK
ncbi:MAG TPA: P-loop NTPase fold protein [Candidatus Saccharibacteria bacterium]|nr:P-loop NTPase fold protein [Candidatus Saccharibacteria bacterium]HRK94589.1 P-loop NTPase fold protein [Candidatus Saccharibacteria bacterium]